MSSRINIDRGQLKAFWQPYSSLTHTTSKKKNTPKNVWKRHVIVQQLHLVSGSIKCHNAECQNIQCRFKRYKQNPQLPPKFLIIRNKDMLLQVMLVSPVLEPSALLQGPLFQHQKNLSSSPLGSSEHSQLGYRKAGGTQASLPSFMKVKKKSSIEFWETDIFHLWKWKSHSGKNMVCV